jgi:hypothetical protein
MVADIASVSEDDFSVSDNNVSFLTNGNSTFFRYGFHQPGDVQGRLFLKYAMRRYCHDHVSVTYLEFDIFFCKKISQDYCINMVNDKVLNVL